MDDLKVPVTILLLILAGAGYFFYNKKNNPTPKFKPTKNIVETVPEKSEADIKAEKAEALAALKKQSSDVFKSGDYTETLKLIAGKEDSNDYQIQKMFGYSYAAAKEYDKAIVAFEKALKISKIPSEGYSLAYLYEITGRYGAAAGLYEELASADLPSNLRRSVFEGIARISAHYPENKNLYKYTQELLEDWPDSKDGVIALAKLMKERKDFSGIDKFVNKTSKTFSNDYEYNYAVAQLYDAAENYKDAVTYYKKCIKLQPRVYTPFMDCYNALTKAGKTEAAIKALEYFLESGQSYPTTYFKAALEAKRLKRYKTAFRFYLNAVCNDVRLQGKDDEGLMSEAEKEYKERGTELDKTFINAFICYINGDCQYADSELQRIKSEIENSVYKEDYALVVRECNKLLAKDKKRDDEIKAYEDRLRAEEEAKLAKERAAKAQAAKNNQANVTSGGSQLSDNELKIKALKAPSDYNIQLQTAMDFYARGNLKEAKTFFKNAMMLNSKSAIPYVEMARINSMENDYESAENNIEKGVKRDPSNPVALIMAANIFMKQNKLPKAKEYAEQAMQANPLDSQGLIMLAKINIQENNAAKAKELVDQGLATEKNNVRRAELLSLKRQLEGR